jgi:hypothetical protein
MHVINAKPRNEFAGLHRFATCSGLISSRYRGVCRPFVAGFRVAQSGGFIDRFTLHSDFALGKSSDHVCGLLQVLAQDNPRTSCRGWSLPVRLRCTHISGRAQQRNTNAATGSSSFGSRIDPKPDLRSAFSRHLSQISVKAYRISYQWCPSLRLPALVEEAFLGPQSRDPVDVPRGEMRILISRWPVGDQTASTQFPPHSREAVTVPDRSLTSVEPGMRSAREPTT